MKANLGATLVAVLVLVAVGIGGTGNMRPALRLLAHRLGLETSQPLAVGERLGSLSFVSLDGARVRVAPQPGHALLINIFATWCIPCRDEMPAFASSAGKLAAAGVDLIAIDQSENVSQVERFAHSYDLSFPVYIDDQQVSQQKLGAHTIPTTLLVDRRGVVRLMHTGPLTKSDLVAIANSVRGPQ